MTGLAGARAGPGRLWGPPSGSAGAGPGLRGPLILAALACAVAAGPVAGQGAGSAAFTVLRVAPHPRPLALGNAFAAVPSSLSLEYNPAGADGRGVSAGYQELPVGVTAGALSVTAPLGTVTIGGSLRFLDYGEIDVYEPDGDGPVGVPTGATATGGELSALLGAGLRVGRARFGLAGRWLRLDVAGEADAALAADAGLLLDAGHGLHLGASVQNLGTDVEAGRSAPLPRRLRVGAALRRRFGGVSMLATVEGRRGEERTLVGAGLEVGAGTEAVDAVLRLGFESRAETGDAYAPLVFGGGVRIDRLAVDFAYRSLGPLGSTRQAGLSYRF